ncbi:hypothetical protein [Streptomyces sp. ME18-1-4]|uniref:hypothetical protein n=1 Tax=Streptomyces sp. ME18-1-4 TaxID=3028685 RepID=UPI0029BDED23|nr:hypothetical protein [Streptomyces sp. ME18-1-4]MDX3240860.1 hypothetical protein [Streptomyces sp. ME18-1-4]
MARPGEALSSALDGHAEGRHRLVQQQLRPQRERPRDGDPLPIGRRGRGEVPSPDGDAGMT